MLAQGWVAAAPLGEGWGGVGAGSESILHQVRLCGNAIDAPIREMTAQAQEVQTAGGNGQDEVNVSAAMLS